MLIVEGWVRAAPADIETLKGPLKTMVAATLAEPGCLQYALSEDLLDPGLLRIVEKWTDDAALSAHLQAPHVAAFSAAIAGLARKGTEIKVYHASELRTLVAN